MTIQCFKLVKTCVYNFLRLDCGVYVQFLLLQAQAQCWCFTNCKRGLGRMRTLIQYILAGCRGIYIKQVELVQASVMANQISFSHLH